MDKQLPVNLRELVERCSPEERKLLFRALRAEHRIHVYEEEVGASAEMILEAVHRAPELTRRMLRGVIADAAFAMRTVPILERYGWTDVTPKGNWAYDYMLEDAQGRVTVQVKLQRSEKGSPVIKLGKRYGFDGEVYMTETQKTRTGTLKKRRKKDQAAAAQGEDIQADADLPDVVTESDLKSRPYRYGEFDILAVSMQPSTQKWESYMYTLGRWLLVGEAHDEMAKMQPVSMAPDEWWTDDFQQAVEWLRLHDAGRRMQLVAKAPRKEKAPTRTATDKPPRKRGKNATQPTAEALAGNALTAQPDLFGPESSS